MKKIGFIGLGDMGIYMSRNLMNAGYQVKGYDVSEARMEQFKANGGSVCVNSAMVGLDTDVVIIMVVTAEQVKSVMFGENGLMENLRPGATVIVTATIGNKPMVEIADKAAEKDVHVIDCAVTGGQVGAEAGTLAMMIAAPKDVIENCMDIFEVLGKTIVVAGDKPGLGQIIKACNGVMSAVTTVGMCEAMALGVAAGADPEVITQVLSNGTCGSPLFSNYAQKIMSRKFAGGGVQLKLLYKDTNLCMELAKECGIPLHATAVSNETIQEGMTKYPGEDCWSLVKIFEEITGVEVKKN